MATKGTVHSEGRIAVGHLRNLALSQARLLLSFIRIEEANMLIPCFTALLRN
jgi:hypothetical protein